MMTVFYVIYFLHYTTGEQLTRLGWLSFRMTVSMVRNKK